MKITKLVALGTVAACAVLAATRSAWAQEYISGMKWDEPKVVTPGKTSADPPSDAVILFDGKDLSAWENGDKWIVKDGVATIGKGDITMEQLAATARADMFVEVFGRELLVRTTGVGA